MIIETFRVGLLQCNCTILGDESTGDAIVIDPGDNASEIFRRLDEHQLCLKQIVCTHTHIDHVGAIFELQERTAIPALFHGADAVLYDNLEIQARWIGVPTPRRGVIGHFIEDGDAVGCRGIEIGVLHTPGHTPGSTTFQLRSNRDILFTGDTLFRNSIGRTDLWGGSYPEILQSINGRLMTFDDDTLVIAGHGASTTIGEERRGNPFLR